MLHEKALLAIPGPTPLAPSVQRAQARDMINHRSEAFVQLFHEVADKLKQVYLTKRPVVVLPAAGTGAMEAALVNFLSPGDKVLALVAGAFGDRWASIAKGYGLDVERVDIPWGGAVEPQVLADRLTADSTGDIKAVLVTHNETSTGVTNPLQQLAAAKGDHPALLMVDSVSGLGAVPLRMDDWNLDVVITGSQKGLACPPGLAFIAFGPRAEARMASARLPRFYFDLRSYMKDWAKASPPYTPAVSLWYALLQALRNLEEETLEGSWARHQLLGEMTRAGVKALGLGLLAADEAYASNAVTAVVAPEGLDPKKIRKIAREQFGVVLAGGQKHLADTVFRIGHVGYMAPQDVLQALGAVELTLALNGQEDAAGKATVAAQQVWLKKLRAAGL